MNRGGGGANEGFARALHGKLQGGAPGDGVVSIDFQHIVLQADFHKLLLGALGLNAEDALPAEAQVEQALIASHCRGKGRTSHGLVLELGVAGQEKPIIQHHGAIPAAGSISHRAA